MSRLLLLFCLAAAPTLAAAPAGPSPVELGSFRDWTAYSYDSGPKKQCYMVSRPKKSEGKVEKRGQPHLMVTHRPGGKAFNEVSVAAGYPFKPESKVTAQVDEGKKFELFTRDDKAWSEKEDAKLVEAFKSGDRLEVRGTPAKGPPTVDSYSLAGFGAAHQAIGKACNVK
jgi:hypothetical protein